MGKKTALLLLLGFGLLLAAPCGDAYGAQDAARVVGYTGEMVMGADGSLTVEEYMTWQISGSPDLTRRLDVSNATSVEDVGVYRVTDPDPVQPQEAARIALWSSGTAAADTYDYAVTEEMDGRYLEFTLRPDSEGRYLTLVFTYRLTDCAYLYQDGAAFYFNPLWQAGEGRLDSFFMHCRLGEDIEPGEGEPQYYANGGITEEWTGADLYSSHVDLATGLEVVAVLPVSWVPQGRKTVQNDILPHLQAQQQIFAAQREELFTQQQNALARSRLTLWVAGAIMAAGMVLLFLLYGIRPSRRQQRQTYLPPSRHLPGEARLLLRKSLSRRTALAELIYLWHRGYVKLIQGKDGQWTLKQEKRSDAELSLHDQYLLSFLVHHSGGAADDIRDKLSDPTAFKIWKGLVKKTVAQKGIIKEARAAWVIGLGLGVMEWVLAAMIVVNINAWDTAILVAAMGVLVAGYGCMVRKVTPEEMREIIRYRTYARQLRREEGCAGPWRRQLAYAMALGVERPLLKVLIKDGSGEVSAFAAWVRHVRFKRSLSFLQRSKPVKGNRKKKSLRQIGASRHEAAATRIEEYGKRPEIKYRKREPGQKPKPLKPISAGRHGSEKTQADRRGTHTKYPRPDPKKWPPRGLKRR